MNNLLNIIFFVKLKNFSEVLRGNTFHIRNYILVFSSHLLLYIFVSTKTEVCQLVILTQLCSFKLIELTVKEMMEKSIY
jgi:hypothetical protein